VSHPILRATTGTGEVYDDPSEDLLFMLLEDFEGVELSQRWFMLERRGPSRDGEYLRVLVRGDGTYGIEGPDADGIDPIPSMRRAHDALTRWACDLPDWRVPLSVQPGGELPDAIGIGVIEDPNPANRPWRHATQQLSIRLPKVSAGVETPLRLVIVFQIAGRLWKPEFSGVRIRSFTQESGCLGIDVALPEEVPVDAASFVKRAMHEAIDQAEAWAQQRGIASDLSQLRMIVDRA
jgi:hypothetical protein